jgi:hypothetical protein
MEVTRRQGRRCKKLLDDLKDRRGYSHLKEEALDRTVWRNRFGRGFGPVVRRILNEMNSRLMYFCVNIVMIWMIKWKDEKFIQTSHQNTREEQTALKIEADNSETNCKGFY